ncbi:MAG: hypothetical protein ACR2PF_17300 [Rhizobiaceae bacterium]
MMIDSHITWWVIVGFSMAICSLGLRQVTLLLHSQGYRGKSKTWPQMAHTTTHTGIFSFCGLSLISLIAYKLFGPIHLCELMGGGGLIRH